MGKGDEMEQRVVEMRAKKKGPIIHQVFQPEESSGW